MIERSIGGISASFEDIVACPLNRLVSLYAQYLAPEGSSGSTFEARLPGPGPEHSGFSAVLAGVVIYDSFIKNAVIRVPAPSRAPGFDRAQTYSIPFLRDRGQSRDPSRGPKGRGALSLSGFSAGAFSAGAFSADLVLEPILPYSFGEDAFGNVPPAEGYAIAAQFERGRERTVVNVCVSYLVSTRKDPRVQPSRPYCSVENIVRAEVTQTMYTSSQRTGERLDDPFGTITFRNGAVVEVYSVLSEGPFMRAR